MTRAHHRKKDPEEVRRRLLEASISLAAESGPHAVTVEAVSRRAGVSRGGFQHHFPTRSALLEAVFDELWARFHLLLSSCIASDPEEPGRFSRSYLHTNDLTSTEAQRSLSRAALALTLSDAEFRRRWSERMSELIPTEEASTLEGQAKLLICRLAADGLWLADLLSVQAPSPELRTEMMRQLDELSRRA